MTAIRWIGFIVLMTLWLAFLCWYSVGQVHAHEWFTGKRNPATNEGCCNHVDCRIITNDDWWMEGGFIKVKWSDGRVYSMPASQAQPTEDREGRPAACVLAGRLRCAFIPLGY
jgi:hypothetical protein